MTEPAAVVVAIRPHAGQHWRRQRPDLIYALHIGEDGAPGELVQWTAHLDIARRQPFKREVGKKLAALYNKSPRRKQDGNFAFTREI